MSPSPSPYRIEIPQVELDDLNRRLKTTRWPGDYANDDWSYGVEQSWLKEMVDYWADRFEWRAQEAAINTFPQFRVVIDEVPIHFIHVRGKEPNAKPLILTHGWPWTFHDWLKLIGPLSDPAAHGGDPADAFDVVVPSLPGFGFSGPLRKAGVNYETVAELWRKLMTEVLGYRSFLAAGGDWGAFVTMSLGQHHSKDVDAIYLSFPIAPGVDIRSLPREAYAADEAWMLKRMAEALPAIQSHLIVHARDPQTLAYALNDSPVGLAAWLWERRRGWSDCDGDVLKAFDRDFLCTTASIYWFGGTIGASMRFYAERARMTPAAGPARIDVPTAYASAPKELLFTPRAVLAEKTNLQRWALPPSGGHFLPAERPDFLIGEYRAFFRGYR